MSKDCAHFTVMKGFDGQYYCRDCDEPAQVTFIPKQQMYGDNPWRTEESNTPISEK